MSIVIGVDLGTTKITSLALEIDSGRVIAVGTAANDANNTAPADRRNGRSEWDSVRIAALGFQCIRQVSEQLGSRIADVTGIGVTGQQHGMVLTDADDEPLSPLFNWQDRRGLDKIPDQNVTYLDETRRRLGEDVWKRTGCRVQPGFMAVTLVFLKNSDLIRSDSRALFITDLFTSLLTGERATTEPTCAGGSGVFNVRTRQWDDGLIDQLGVSRSLFPEVREANELIGTLTPEIAVQCGFPSGIPVFAGIGDHQASFVGSVADRRNSILVNVGTGAQVAIYTDGFDFTPPVELRPFPCRGNLLSNVGLAGGWSYQVLEQFFRDIGTSVFQSSSETPLYERLNQLAESAAAGADGLRCEPLFAGTRTDPTIRGSLSGLSPVNFTARHLARSVLEGMARSLRDGYGVIEGITKQSPTHLVAAGNGLRENRLLAEIVSKSFERPLTFTPYREEAAVGAALIAKAGVQGTGL